MGLLRLSFVVQLSREEGRGFGLVDLDVDRWYCLVGLSDCCGEGAPDSTGVLSCLIISCVLPDRGQEKVCCVLVPSGRCLTCSVYGL